MLKILVIDDDPFTTQILALTFRDDSCELRAVNDSREAVPTALEFGPDIVLLDIMMPIKDGIEVCQEMREQPALQDTRIIMLTAAEDMGKRVAAFQAGATDFLTKPIHPREFREQIKNWTSSSG
jgi:two-component system alkaline phosphatase synthesis response regulator PhoP